MMRRKRSNILGKTTRLAIPGLVTKHDEHDPLGRARSLSLEHDAGGFHLPLVALIHGGLAADDGLTTKIPTLKPDRAVAERQPDIPRRHLRRRPSA